ncbi:MAG: hypothetical protein M0004_11430 [Actinomycetota bacterium]|nr:hypothetical protein [Actinomycetota bacterium]
MTNDLVYDFEKQLLSDLHEAQRLAGAKVRARRHVVPRRFIPITGAGLAISGGTIAAVAMLGTASAPFPGWAPLASAATSTQVASADQGCEPALSTAGQAGEANWRVVASEDQGPYTLLVYASGHDMATCLLEPGMKLTLDSFGSGAVPTAGEIVIGGGSANGDSAGELPQIGPTSVDGRPATVIHAKAAQGGYTVVEGAVDSGVTGLSLVRADGTAVETSVANGWFAAWWPGSDNPVASKVTTAAGTTSMPVPAPTVPRSPSAPAAGRSGALAGSSGASPVARGTSGSTAGDSGPSASAGSNQPEPHNR